MTSILNFIKEDLKVNSQVAQFILSRDYKIVEKDNRHTEKDVYDTNNKAYDIKISELTKSVNKAISNKVIKHSKKVDEFTIVRVLKCITLMDNEEYSEWNNRRKLCIETLSRIDRYEKCKTDTILDAFYYSHLYLMKELVELELIRIDNVMLNSVI